MADMRRVAVVHTANDASMDLVAAGIEEYRREHPGWVLRQQYNAPRTAAEIDEFLAWRPDGVLTASRLPPALVQALLTARIPCVAMRGRFAPHAVLVDERAVGEAAAGHLAGLGAVTLMYIRFVEDHEEGQAWQEGRNGGFVDGLVRRGQRGRALNWPTGDVPLAEAATSVMAQVRTVPRPCAIFTGNDYFALALIEFVLAAGLRVPSDVAILGADDIPRASAVAVPVSSVQVPHRAIGARAAAMLAELLAGGATAPRCVALAPAGIAIRASTDAVGVRDPEVAAVLQFMRAHAGEPFDVGDAVQASQLSRRSIEQRFRSVLGRSVLEEIHRIRIERAQAMLRDPNRSITEIALDCGFSESPYFTVVFRKLVGETPSVWRRRQLNQP
jgi:LacI family transcriptional regulator